MLALVHALFLTAHDRRLQFPVHKNVPLQPLKKRSSRYLNMTAPQTVATAAAAAADTDEESEDDEALHRERAADLYEENLLLNQESAHGMSGTGTGAGIMDPVFGSLQSRFCRTSEGAAPQWRVWGSEAHWYRYVFRWQRTDSCISGACLSTCVQLG